MQIQFTNSIDDIVSFSWHHFRHSKSLQRWYRIGFLVGPIFGAIYAVLFARWSLPSRIALALAVAVAWAVWMWMYYRWWIPYSARKLTGEGKNKGLLGGHTITITEEGLTETTEVNESRSSWEGIEKIEENEQYIFIYISAYQAHVIPKCAFASEKGEREFIEQARFYLSGSGI